MTGRESILGALDRAGYHVTEPRRTIAGLVAGREGRFSADQLVREASRVPRPVGRATVFRSLEIFESLGLVERVHLERGGHAYVACDPERHHHHVVCRRCGRTADVGDVGIAPIASAVEERTGFVVDSHRIEFLGLCPDCRARLAESP